MLRAQIQHPTMVRLAKKLGVRKPEAIGLVEMLYHATTEHHPDGGIGRMDDLDLAIVCDWHGEPGDFVRALIEESVLVEVGGNARLVVAEWSTRHATDHIHRRLAAAREKFADGSAPRIGKMVGRARPKFFSEWRAKWGEAHPQDDSAPDGANAEDVAPHGANGRQVGEDGADGPPTSTRARANTRAMPCHTKSGQSPPPAPADDDAVPDRATPKDDTPSRGWGDDWPVPSPRRDPETLPEMLSGKVDCQWTRSAWREACAAADRIESVEGDGVAPVVDPGGQGRALALTYVLDAYRGARYEDEVASLRATVLAITTLWRVPDSPWLGILNGLRKHPDGAMLSPQRQRGRKGQPNRMEQAERLSVEPKWARMLDELVAEGVAL